MDVCTATNDSGRNVILEHPPMIQRKMPSNATITRSGGRRVHRYYCLVHVRLALAAWQPLPYQGMDMCDLTVKYINLMTKTESQEYNGVIN